MCRGALFVLILCGLRFHLVLSTLCYYPDGITESPDVPCNQSAVDAGGHTSCSGADALCLDNGLCFGYGIVSRGSCTDTSWGEECPNTAETIVRLENGFVGRTEFLTMLNRSKRWNAINTL